MPGKKNYEEKLYMNFQLLELFVPDNIKLLGNDISCYFKNKAETVKWYKNNL